MGRDDGSPGGARVRLGVGRRASRYFRTRRRSGTRRVRGRSCGRRAGRALRVDVCRTQVPLRPACRRKHRAHARRLGRFCSRVAPLGTRRPHPGRLFRRLDRLCGGRQTLGRASFADGVVRRGSFRAGASQCDGSRGLLADGRSALQPGMGRTARSDALLARERRPLSAGSAHMAVRSAGLALAADDDARRRVGTFVAQLVRLVRCFQSAAGLLPLSPRLPRQSGSGRNGARGMDGRRSARDADRLGGTLSGQ